MHLFDEIGKDIALIVDISLCFYNIEYLYIIRILQSKTQQFFYFVLKTS